MSPLLAAYFKSLRAISALREIFTAGIFPWISMVDSAVKIVAGVTVVDAAVQGLWFMV